MSVSTLNGERPLSDIPGDSMLSAMQLLARVENTDTNVRED